MLCSMPLPAPHRALPTCLSSRLPPPPQAQFNKPVVVEEFGKARPAAARNALFEAVYDEVSKARAAGRPVGGSLFWMLAGAGGQSTRGCGRRFGPPCMRSTGAAGIRGCGRQSVPTAPLPSPAPPARRLPPATCSALHPGLRRVHRLLGCTALQAAAERALHTREQLQGVRRRSIGH